MRKYQYDSIPALTTNEGKTLLICFGAEEKEVTIDNMHSDEEEAETRTIFEAYSVRVSLPTSYEQVTSAIIDAAYPNDQMQAIINNHLLESDNAEHEAEFAAMQEWRKQAKEIAKQVMVEFEADLLTNN